MSKTHLRCAIYTRKSTEEGLDQDFNSLKAQREACEAYVRSQKHEGWKTILKHYDDGGLSGGTMERPALQELLDDIREGKVEIVLVYKIDRLTRSLMDFAKIVETFEARSVSFVSVTQQFNTTTSMGRLTLNVLLSFAQFEREVTAERIRDKIAASKKKGMWMGGLAPLGYDVKDKALVVNEREAKTVRQLFELYLSLDSVNRLKRQADELGLKTKTRVSGIAPGGRPFSRGHLYRLLSNPLYIGKVAHRGQRYPGVHEAIIDHEIWDAVQGRLEARAPSRNNQRNVKEPSLLTGLLFDETGDRLTPSHAVKTRRRYRYYVSHRLMEDSEASGWRLPASEIEQRIIEHLCRFLGDRSRLVSDPCLNDLHPGTLRALFDEADAVACRLRNGPPTKQRQILTTMLHRIEIGAGEMRLVIDRQRAVRLLAGAASAGSPSLAETLEPLVHVIAFDIKRRGVEAKLVVGSNEDRAITSIDDGLIELIRKAYGWHQELSQGRVASIEAIAARDQIDAGDVSRFVGLAFLAPDIIDAILDGRQPVELTAQRLKRATPLPLLWSKQRSLLGFV